MFISYCIFERKYLRFNQRYEFLLNLQYLLYIYSKKIVILQAETRLLVTGFHGEGLIIIIK